MECRRRSKGSIRDGLESRQAEERSKVALPTACWIPLNAMMGSISENRTSTGQWLPTVNSNYEMQGSDCSRNQRWGVHDQSAEGSDRYHASQSFNGVNGPADGRHPG